jgi:hypothetical protein
MKISISPAYRGQLVDLAYLDANGKEKRFMRVLGAAPLEVNDDPSSSDGIPSTVADALVRKGKAIVLIEEPAPTPEIATTAKRGKDK